MTGFSKNVLKDTTILSKIGFELPFMVDLSSKLKLYNLINDTFYEEKVLVSELW